MILPLKLLPENGLSRFFGNNKSKLNDTLDNLDLISATGLFDFIWNR